MRTSVGLSKFEFIWTFHIQIMAVKIIASPIGISENIFFSVRNFFKSVNNDQIKKVSPIIESIPKIIKSNIKVEYLNW